MFTPQEEKRLHEIANLAHSATAGVSFEVEEVGDDEWTTTMGLFRQQGREIIGNLKAEYTNDGDLFAASRNEIIWLLRLVKRLADPSE